MKWLLAVLLITLLLIIPAAADTVCPWVGCGTGVGWYEEFNTSATENQTYWGTDNASYYTDITKSILWTTDDGSELTFLGNKSLTNGTFFWNFRYINLTNNEAFPELFIGAQEAAAASSTYSPSTSGNKYAFTIYADPAWMAFVPWKVVAGVRSGLGSKLTPWYNNTWYNISIEWWPYNTTPLLFKKDGVYLNYSSSTLYKSGYAGIGQFADWPNRIEWNNVSFTYLPTAGGGPSAPVADFTCTPTSMVRMNKTNCDDLSTNTPTSWLWYGADGCVINSTSENPVLQFGNYSYCKTLCLMATNAGGSDTKCRANYIYILQPWAWF